MAFFLSCREVKITLASFPTFIVIVNILLYRVLTDMNCSTLTEPANGQISYTAGATFGQTATYSCNAGYILVGDSTRTCQPTGVWSGSAPTCQGMLLLKLNYISSETETYNNVLVAFSCLAI